MQLQRADALLLLRLLRPTNITKHICFVHFCSVPFALQIHRTMKTNSETMTTPDDDAMLVEERKEDVAARSSMEWISSF